MGVPASRFLDPATLARLDDLHLLARTVVEGYLAGHHLDARAGVGVEFAQYRGYQPGDDPRRVDWRVYGRSDRYFVRESEVERDVTVRFLLDASASMAHGGGAKLDHARRLVAVLAYLADRQGDRLAFHALTDISRGGAPLPERRALEHLLHRLEGLEARGRWPAWEVLVERLPARRRRELVVVVSDLYDPEGAIEKALRAFRAAGHEVVVFQLLSRDELEFGWEGDLLFEDLETGETVLGNAAAIKGAYLERLGAELERWRRRLLELGVDHEVLSPDQPLDLALRRFLVRRRELP